MKNCALITPMSQLKKWGRELIHQYTVDSALGCLKCAGLVEAHSSFRKAEREPFDFLFIFIESRNFMLPQLWKNEFIKESEAMLVSNFLTDKLPSLSLSPFPSYSFALF